MTLINNIIEALPRQGVIEVAGVVLSSFLTFMEFDSLEWKDPAPAESLWAVYPINTLSCSVIKSSLLQLHAPSCEVVERACPEHHNGYSLHSCGLT